MKYLKLFENKLMDNVLDKISKNGIKSLTKFERDLLDKYSSGDYRHWYDDLIEKLKNIDSHTLEIMSNIKGGDFDESDIDDDANDIELSKKLLNISDDILTFGDFFDWKEENELKQYIEENAKGRHVYNYYPGGDGVGVVFSTIELPNAEEISFE